MKKFFNSIAMLLVFAMVMETPVFAAGTGKSVSTVQAEAHENEDDSYTPEDPYTPVDPVYTTEGSDEKPDYKTQVTGISIDEGTEFTYEVNEDNAYTLNASVVDNAAELSALFGEEIAAPSHDVTWSVEGDAVTKVEETVSSFTFKAVKYGQSVITATAVGGKSVDVTVNVKAYATEIKFEDNIPAEFNKKHKINFSNYLDVVGGNDNITWTLDSTKYAKVDKNGVVSMNKVTPDGTVVKLTAAGERNQSATTTFIITDGNPATKIEIKEIVASDSAKGIQVVKKDELVMPAEKEGKYDVVITTGKDTAEAKVATTDDITVTSSKEAVATAVIDKEGKLVVTPKTVGKANITVKATSGKSAKIAITVKATLSGLKLVAVVPKGQNATETTEVAERVGYPGQKITLVTKRELPENTDKLYYKVVEDESTTVKESKFVSVSSKGVITVNKNAAKELGNLKKTSHKVTVRVQNVKDYDKAMKAYTDAQNGTDEEAKAKNPKPVAGTFDVIVKGGVVVKESIKEIMPGVKTFTVNVGDQHKFAPDYDVKYDANVETEKPNNLVTWTTSSSKVVTVDENGQIYAVKKGTATIKAAFTTTENKVVTKSIKVKVVQPVTSMSMKKATQYVNAGAKAGVSFSAVMAPKGSTYTKANLVYELKDAETLKNRGITIGKNKVSIVKATTDGTKGSKAGESFEVVAKLNGTDLSTTGKIVVLPGTNSIKFYDVTVKNDGTRVWKKATALKSTKILRGETYNLAQKFNEDVNGDDKIDDGGESHIQLTFDENLTYTVDKKSINIISVDQNGVIYALDTGVAKDQKAKVIVTTDSGKKVTVTVTVTSTPPASDDGGSPGGDDDGGSPGGDDDGGSPGGGDDGKTVVKAESFFVKLFKNMFAF